MRNLIALAYDIIDTNNNYKSNHLTFIIQRTTIIAIGKNYEDRSHPLAKRWGYWDGVIHSELDAIIKATREKIKINRCSLWNIRIDRWGKVKIAKPCIRCERLINSFNINKIFWTNGAGQWTS